MQKSTILFESFKATFNVFNLSVANGQCYNLIFRNRAQGSKAVLNDQIWGLYLESRDLLYYRNYVQL